MKMKDVAVDADRAEAGAWVKDIPDMEGLRLKVRGANNKDWRRTQMKLIQATPRKRRMSGNLDPDDSDRITTLCLLNTSLLDWEGLEDDDGKAIPYSREMAEKLLTEPDFRRFREAAAWAANWVAEQSVAEVEEDAGNLLTLSPTSTGGERKLKAG
jgi:hypothetical protein